MFTVEEVEWLMKGAASGEGLLCRMCRHKPTASACESNDFKCTECTEKQCRCKDCNDAVSNFALDTSEYKNGWIRCDAKRKRSYNWFCPHCGEKANYIGGGRDCEYRYCPWCGKEVNG